MLKITVNQIQALINGTVEGPTDAIIANVAKLDEAVLGDLCFFANPKYEDQFYASNATIILIPQNFQLSKPHSATLIRHSNPYYAFCILLNAFFNPNKHKSGIEAGAYKADSAVIGNDVYIGHAAYVDDNATIGNGVKIYPQVFVGEGCKIGENTILFPGVKVYAGCNIGANCIIHAGTVIGSDGFGFAPIGDVYAKIPQIGNVIVEDNVEIGSNCSIDRASMGSTIIKSGTKLDNLIQVAHNATIGKNTVIAAQAGISGSTKIGDNCQIGGQTGFVGHISIANRVGVGAQAGVSKAIEEEGSNWIGSPAMPLKDFFKSQAVFKNLAALQKRINELEYQLNNISNNKP